MTATIRVPCYGKSGTVAKKFGGKSAGSLLALAAGLEASLEQSRKALLSLDLPAIVARTGEQILLSRELAVVLCQASGGLSASPDLPEELQREKLQIEQVRVIAERIISAIRLQSALLVRLRTKLRVMANMLAGPSAVYSSMLEGRLRVQPQA